MVPSTSHKCDIIIWIITREPKSYSKPSKRTTSSQSRALKKNISRSQKMFAFLEHQHSYWVSSLPKMVPPPKETFKVLQLSPCSSLNDALSLHPARARKSLGLPDSSFVPFQDRCCSFLYLHILEGTLGKPYLGTWKSSRCEIASCWNTVHFSLLVSYHLSPGCDWNRHLWERSWDAHLNASIFKKFLRTHVGVLSSTC